MLDEKEIRRNLKFDLADREVEEQFEQLCLIQCTGEEVAAFFKCSVDTISSRISEHYGVRFSEIMREKKNLGKVSLRRDMYRKAQKGNVTMQIWLAKNYLGMSDKHMVIDAPAEIYEEPDFLKES